MRATRRAGVHRHAAIRTILGRLLRCRLNEDLRDTPGDETDDEKIDGRCQKVTEPELYRTDVPGHLLPLSTGCNHQYHRHDEIVDHGLDERIQGGPDDDGDSKCDDVLLEQKLLELFQHGHWLVRLGFCREG